MTDTGHSEVRFPDELESSATEDSQKARDTSSNRGAIPATLYVVIVIVCMILVYGYKLRGDGIFACASDLYAGDRYLAYCQAVNYADYDHGALFFELEREAYENARSADVLFLGSSRLQFGFSSNATIEWFNAHDSEHFLLGFGNTDNIAFVDPLLATMQPSAKAYVINVDRFFESEFTNVARHIIENKEALEEYRSEQKWQRVHRPFCSLLPWACGSRLAFFRDRHQGHWFLDPGEDLVAAPTGLGENDEKERWPQFVTNAERFIAKLPVAPGCVFLTLVPSSQTQLNEARFIADGLGLTLIYPNLASLQTFDGSHLEHASAERWSTAFFDEAGGDLSRCVQTEVLAGERG